MGYPMTYQRVIHRASLLRDRSSYDETAPWPTVGLNLDAIVSDKLTAEGKVKVVQEHWVPALEGVRLRLRMLAGDLRRLEDDTTDENVVVNSIAARTGIDIDDVAAVLAAWMEV